MSKKHCENCRWYVLPLFRGLSYYEKDEPCRLGLSKRKNEKGYCVFYQKQWWKFWAK